MRVRALVCGGRHFHKRTFLFATLDRLDAELGITDVIEGEAPGADQLAALWASQRGKNLHPFPADWGDHGRAAGPLRNKRMLEEGHPDIVIAFPGGKGTANMVAQARKAGVRVVEVSEKE